MESTETPGLSGDALLKGKDIKGQHKTGQSTLAPGANPNIKRRVVDVDKASQVINSAQNIRQMDAQSPIEGSQNK